MDSEPFSGQQYSEFMARLCAERGVETYLEIGVENGLNLQKIQAREAYAVDPAFKFTIDPSVNKSSVVLFRGPSDSFFRSKFARIMASEGVDFAFLDGMHLFEYLLRDVYNTESCSNSWGLIALHDCMPFNSEMIERVLNLPGRKLKYSGAWTGDVWKIVPILRKYRPDLTIRLVDCAPTGLVFITNLDRKNTILKDAYLDIVEEFMAMPNDADSLERYYRDNKVYSAAEIGNDYSQSLFFRT